MLAFAFFLFTLSANDSTQITLNFSGIEGQEGSISVAFYDSEKSYMENGFIGTLLPVESTSLSWTLMLPKGSYAVAAYHDKNNNAELDTGWFGVPKEPYGFSNNVRPAFRAANWKESHFEAGDKALVLEIELK